MSKKPDYLTLCSIAAQKAGTSYGKYMAMHGYHPPIQADVEDVEAPQALLRSAPSAGRNSRRARSSRKSIAAWSARKPTPREPLKGDTATKERRLTRDKEMGR